MAGLGPPIFLRLCCATPGATLADRRPGPSYLLGVCRRKSVLLLPIRCKTDWPRRRDGHPRGLRNFPTFCREDMEYLRAQRKGARDPSAPGRVTFVTVLFHAVLFVHLLGAVARGGAAATESLRRAGSGTKVLQVTDVMLWGSVCSTMIADGRRSVNTDQWAPYKAVHPPLSMRFSTTVADVADPSPPDLNASRGVGREL
jgi:hypothetical protein